MGGFGSGRKPDIFKQIAEQKQAIANSSSDSIYLPNLSGVSNFAKKTGTNFPQFSVPFGDASGGLTFDQNGLQFDPGSNALRTDYLSKPNIPDFSVNLTVSELVADDGNLAINWSNRAAYDQYATQAFTWGNGGLCLMEYTYILTPDTGCLAFDYANGYPVWFDGTVWNAF